jgi:cytochrome c biogenesis protein CcmG, thiol:disulfide interchange protein DsbE
VSDDVDQVDAPEDVDPAPRRSRTRVIVLTLVPVIAFAVLLGSGLGRDPRALPSERIDDRAPAFSLPELGGQGDISAPLEGQVVVVNFWASWCTECRLEHPALAAAWDRYRERGVVFVGVAFEDAEGPALAYASEQGGDWPLVMDPGSRTAIAYGVFGVPETFVIAPDGTIAAKTVGEVTYTWLTEEIDRALRTDVSA